MTFDLDDPATWPSDEQGWAALEQEGAAVAEPDDGDDQDEEIYPGEADPKPEPQDDKPVVLAKDGVHTIPYQRVEELQDRVRDLEARLAKEPESAGTTADPGDVEVRLQERLAKLQEREVQVRALDPDLADTYLPHIEALQDRIEDRALWRAERAQIQSLLAREQDRQAQAEQAANQERQAAFEQTAVLRQWVEARPDLYQAAVQEHTRLMQASPAYGAKTWPERFAQLERRIAEDHGVPLPAAKQEPRPAPAKSRARAVTSMEELGGESVNGMTQDEQLERMSPAKQQAFYLRQAGHG